MLLLGLLFFVPLSARAQQAEESSVLLLNSYHEGLSWTAAITRGVMQQLKESNDNIQLQVEYLDSKRRNETQYLSQVADSYFSFKIRNSRFDLVIVSDNDAFNFALKHRDDLFKGKPIVFCGVNGYTPQMHEGKQDISGIAEVPAVAANLEFIKKIHPETNEIFVIGSTTDATGQRNTALFRRQEKKFHHLKFTYLNDMVLEELIPRLQQLRRGQVVYLSRTLRDHSGRFYNYAEAAHKVRVELQVPLYGSWDFFLGHGILGGKLINGETQGRAATKLALQVLAGQDPDQIPVRSDVGTMYMFDNNELRRFGVDTSLLPQPNKIINQPVSFYTLNRRLVQLTLGFIFLLSLLSLFLIHQVVQRRRSELGLRESEQRFRDIAMHVGDWIWEINTERHCIYTSDNVETVLGYPPDQILGKDFCDLMSQEEGERFRHMLLHHFHCNQPFRDYEAWLNHRDHSPLCLLFSATPILNEGGRICGFRGAAKDITRRKFNEQELQWRRAEFAAIIDAISDAVVYTNPQRQIVLINPAFTRMFGYQPQEVRNRSVACIYAHKEDFIEQGRQRFGPAATKKTDTYEISYISKEGTIIPGETLGAQVRNEAGEILGYLGVIRDVSERKQLEAERALIIEKSPIPIMVVDQEERIFQVNRRFEELIGYAAKDVPTLSSLVAKTCPPGSDPKAKRDSFRATLHDSGAGVQGDRKLLQLLDREQNLRQVEINAVTAGKYQVFSLLDQTEQLALEYQLEQTHKMEALGTMAGGIAHDFNNLLAIIGGNVELLARRYDQPKARENHLGNIRKATERAANLVKQILSFSRQDLHQAVRSNITASLDEALTLLRSTLPTTVEIQSRISDSPLVVMIDTIQLQQVVFNLCSNAVDAMQQKGVLQVALDPFRADQDKPGSGFSRPGRRYARLMISDTGTGMDEKTLKRVFDPFFTTKAAGKGTGMGLSVVHGIVKRHGGEIEVESTLGQGSSFIIYLPLAEGELEAKEPPDLPTGAEAEGHLLLVDDEELLLESTAELLEDCGYQVTSCTSGTEALERFRNNPQQFDLLISDQTMPQLSGAELAREVLSLRPGVPIILCSGYTSQISEEEAAKRGIGAFMTKPVEMPLLLGEIKRLLKPQG